MQSPDFIIHIAEGVEFYLHIADITMSSPAVANTFVVRSPCCQNFTSGAFLCCQS